MKNNQLLTVYNRLFKQYGAQHWWPAETSFEMMVGAILTQSAAWQNVEKAMHNLKTAGALSPDRLRALPVEEIAKSIRPSGYYNAKAKKLQALVTWLAEACGDDIPRLAESNNKSLRGNLLNVHGVGPETADAILLYAIGKPTFVIDAYTRRIFSRLNIKPEKDTYEAWQKLFLDNLPEDTRLYNEYHALLVAHGKNHCRTKPLCIDCCLFDFCVHGHAN
ncbi:MAG: endonuclease III domain-containing protein [Dehalococcoidales bacterium]|nr:endonuclease III domain-containing protein [Dehalococcoidales bacterium]